MKARSGGLCTAVREAHLNGLRPPRILVSNYLTSSGKGNCGFLGGTSCSQDKPSGSSTQFLSTQKIAQEHRDKWGQGMKVSHWPQVLLSQVPNCTGPHLHQFSACSPDTKKTIQAPSSTPTPTPEPIHKNGSSTSGCLAQRLGCNKIPQVTTLAGPGAQNAQELASIALNMLLITIS